MRSSPILALEGILLLLVQTSHAFLVSPTTRVVYRPTTLHSTNTETETGTKSTSTSTSTTTTTTIVRKPKAKPRTGIAQKILDYALTSPLWKLVLVPQARKNIVKTAEANGIAWEKCYQWFQAQDGPWNNNVSKEAFDKKTKFNTQHYPAYYKKAFHAYQDGNLSWGAAIEQELASRAIGARNFPASGVDGEDAFRSSFEQAILRLGGDVRPGGIIVDLGCGTGTSTRRLGSLFPNSDKLLGIDLSPYFITVGRKLLELKPRKRIGKEDGADGDWVTTIEQDERIELRVGDATDTKLDDESVDAVNISLVIHELPIDVTIQVCKEVHRILKPGGQLFISEMDFDSPAYAAQRENAMLFSLLRSTEPYLDDYADGVGDVREFLVQQFQSVKITAATGRHYALVATKDGNTSTDGAGKTPMGVFEDTRFDENGSYTVNDTHLKVWESKEG